MAGYWREYVDWGRHDLLVPPRLICSPRPPGRRWAERVFMYLPGIVSDRSWRQGRIPILYALPVWSAKQPANWPGTSASIRYARSDEHTSELQSLMRNSYAAFCLQTQNNKTYNTYNII